MTDNKTTENHEHIGDDDDDQLHVEHKIVPTIYNTTTQEPHTKDVPTTTTTTITTITEVTESNDFNVHMKDLIKKDPEKYIYIPAPKDYSGLVQCEIKCHKEGLLTKIFSLYFSGHNDNDRTFILTAKKHLKIDGHSDYYLGTDEATSKSLTDENAIAKLKGMNLSGTEYIFYNQNNQQTIAIIYEKHMFGTKGPRKIKVLLSEADKPFQQLKGNETIINEWQAGRTTGLIEMKNRTPIYDEVSKRYCINFMNNRVQQPSHKNFQLVLANENHEENIILQFGRIDENSFALDYRYPLTAIQAFAIALSVFHHRFNA